MIRLTSSQLVMFFLLGIYIQICLFKYLAYSIIIDFTVC